MLKLSLNYLTYISKNYINISDLGAIDNSTNTTASSSANKVDSFEIKNVKSSVERYLNIMTFIRRELIEQLEFYGYSTDSAKYAVDCLDVSWNNQAMRREKSYLESMSFSRSSLKEQIMFDGFTEDQAEIAVIVIFFSKS